MPRDFTRLKPTRSKKAVDKIKHTPLPWAVDPDGRGTPWNIETADGATPIALAAQLVGDDMKQSTRSANAAFIVRACNAHDDLLEALQFYVTICGNTAHSIDPQTAREMYDKGRAAINKALGR